MIASVPEFREFTPVYIVIFRITKQANETRDGQQRPSRSLTHVQASQSVQRLQSVGAHVGQRRVSMDAGDSPDVGVPLLLRRTAQDDGCGVIRSNVCVNNKVQDPLGLLYCHVSPAVNSGCKSMTFILAICLISQLISHHLRICLEVPREMLKNIGHSMYLAVSRGPSSRRPGFGPR